MKKRLSLIIFAVALMATLAIAASAQAYMGFDIADTTMENVYKVVGTINDTEDFRALKITLTFDNSIFVPVSKTKGTEANIAGGTVKTPLSTASYYDEDNEETISAAYTPGFPKWTVDGTKVTLEFESYTSTFFSAKDLVAFEMYFKYADGKSSADLKNDSFVVNFVQYVNSIDNFYGNADASKNNLDFENNVVPAPAEKLTVPVTAGDIIYLQDDTVFKAETTGDFELPKTDDGYVVVNTGFTAQKLYKVESGKITEVTSNENGVLATDSASLRKDSTATGLRFKTSFLTSLKDSVKEYGVLVTVESKNNDLPENYVLNMALVNAGKAKKGVAFNKANGTDIYYDVDGARTIVTAVATGIPLTKDAVTTNIAARPYYELEDGTIIYGETVKRQAAEVAQKIKNEDAETYAKYKDYIDQIIALVAEDPTYATIDLGPLFS
jgi:hypothetical protein